MGSIHKTPYFFRSEPLFGLDIGKSSLKVVQIDTNNPTKPRVLGYGSTAFNSSAVEDGVIVHPELIAEAAQKLFAHGLVGAITTRRCAITIPTYRTFTRSIQLPALPPSELAEAVRLEAEQYITVPLDDLYLDYTVIASTKDSTEILAIAIPRAIVDSYLELGVIMNLEVVLIESTMSANGRLFSQDAQSDVTSVIIDIGSMSSDISIYDGSIITTGTVELGGVLFTQAIEKQLGVSTAEADIIKAKYGLNKSRRQAEIVAALRPNLDTVSKEIKRLIRYYTEHYGTDRPIQQVITLGGGANLPGLSDYFTSDLRLAVRTFDPWQCIQPANLQPPSTHDRSLFSTAVGVALVPSKEVFK
jgi:type IV pilus assembly protein PilM